MLNAMFREENKVNRYEGKALWFDHVLSIRVSGDTPSEKKAIGTIANDINAVTWASPYYSVRIDYNGRHSRDELRVFMAPNHYTMELKAQAQYRQGVLAICGVLASYGVQVYKW